jgi:hypothetical protein
MVVLAELTLKTNPFVNAQSATVVLTVAHMTLAHVLLAKTVVHAFHLLHLLVIFVNVPQTILELIVAYVNLIFFHHLF